MIDKDVKIRPAENGGFIVTCMEERKKEHKDNVMEVMGGMKETPYVAKDFDELMGILRNKLTSNKSDEEKEDSGEEKGEEKKMKKDDKGKDKKKIKDFIEKRNKEIAEKKKYG